MLDLYPVTARRGLLCDIDGVHHRCADVDDDDDDDDESMPSGRRSRGPAVPRSRPPAVVVESGTPILLRLLAFVEVRGGVVEDRGGVVEVMQLGAGFRWYEFKSLEEALAFVIETGPQVARERLRGELAWLR